jgi:His/Glu/Gln/Arg/opine family amino acid ABC transporter permease subunit
MTESPRPDNRETFVNYDEVINRPPPPLTSGPLAWIRKNLFSSMLDTILTLLSAITIVGVVVGGLTWAVRSANWFVITYNLRQFMLGRYDVGPEWRVNLAALFVLVTAGVAIAAYSRARLRAFSVLVVAVVLLFAASVLINATIPLPPSYVTASNQPIQSGSVTQEVLNRLAFTARAGEEIQVAMADALGASDQALAEHSGFMDKAANALRNNAANRLEDEARQAELQRLLATNLLTDNQRTAYTTELERLQVPPSVVETYSLNAVPVQVRLLRGTTLDVLGEATLTADSGPLTISAPEDGWYIIEKTIEAGQEGTDILKVYGLYPLLQRSFTRTTTGGEEGTTATSGRVNQYIRMSDNFLTEEPVPQIDGQAVPYAVIIDNQYRGEHSVADYLRVYLAPFLELIDPALLQMLLAVVGGFVLARTADRFLSPEDQPHRTSNRMASWMLIVSPIMIFVLVYGLGNLLPVSDTRNWGGLLLTMMLTIVGIIGSFPLGILLALGRRSELPVVKYVSTIYIEFVRGVPLITVLFMAQLLVPFLNPALAEVDAVFRAMVGITLFSAAYLAENVRGGLQAIPPGQVEAARALGLAGWQITLLITLPQALRAVIPALVGQFISLFKDTSLVAIVGLIDLTGISNAVVAQTEFIGLRREAYVFITAIYFIFSYVMGYISRKLEESGSGAIRRA